MTENSPPPELGQQAATRAAAALAASKAVGDRRPVPGDVFMLRETAEFPIQWVALARDPSMPGKLLIATVDACDWVGSKDLEIGDESLGRLVLRRPYGGWIQAERLPTDLGVGTLRLDHLSRARGHWFDEKSSLGLTTEEVDNDPEYRDWCASTLEQTCSVVFEAAVIRSSASSTLWPRLVAAAVLLMAIGSWAFISHQAVVSGLVEERHQAEVRHADELEAVKTSRAEAEARLREEVKEQKRWVVDYEDKLSQAGGDPGLRDILQDLRLQTQEALRSVAVINPAVKIIGQARTRGRVEVELPPDATHVVLLLVVDDSQNGDRYQLELRHAGESEVLFKLSGLEVHSLEEIRAGIPAVIFEHGDPYDIHLVKQGQEGFTRDYQIVIR